MESGDLFGLALEEGCADAEVLEEGDLFFFFRHRPGGLNLCIRLV